MDTSDECFPLNCCFCVLSSFVERQIIASNLVISVCILFMLGCILCMEGNCNGQKSCKWKDVPRETVSCS